MHQSVNGGHAFKYSDCLWKVIEISLQQISASFLSLFFFFFTKHPCSANCQSLIFLDIHGHESKHFKQTSHGVIEIVTAICTIIAVTVIISQTKVSFSKSATAK